MQRFEQWFRTRGWSPFDFQRETWRAYLAGRSGLVHAPTGTGKTYAVWLGPILEWLQEESGDATAAKSQPSPLRVLWITPLRALANDTVESLRKPIDELNLPWSIELRTGDTSQSARARQRKRLPSALVTTPESLSLLLSYADCDQLFSTLRCVIVDEWHELMGNKRGVQTELGLAALRSIVPNVRTWGLSATLGNLEQARDVLLGPPEQSNSFSGRLIHADLPRPTRVESLVPDDIERFPWAGHLGLKLLEGVLEALGEAHSTLIFTNTRSQAEIWFQRIVEAAPQWLGEIALHHGSLDRDVRGEVERRLREGSLRAVVCTSSLDLGVDFSPVEQVIQIGSPKGVGRFLQRAGRSGHQPGATSRIIGVPTNALELIEFAAARDGIEANEIESREPIDSPLDLLVQHLVTCGLGRHFREDDLRDEIRSTHAFANLSDDDWQWAMDFVVKGGRTLGAYPQYKKLIERGGRYMVESKPISRMHRMSIGTITSDSSVRVKFVRGATLGTIDESFISRLRPGDRFVFAGRVLELVRVRDMTAQVRRAKKAGGNVPRWMGGRSPLSSQLADAVSQKIEQARNGIYDSPEMQAVRPLLELQSRWSILPRPNQLLIEHTTSREGYHVFVFALAGRLVNEGLSSLAAFRLTRSQPASISVSSNDYGFEMLSRKPLPTDIQTWRNVLSTDQLLEDLLECVNSTQLARRHFREICRIAGLIFPGFPGQGKSARQIQASSDLFFDVFNDFDPDNLLLDQARREVLDRELEVMRLRKALEQIEEKEVKMVETRRFSPLAFPLWVESLRSQHITSERWQDRVKQMVEQLEEKAEETVLTPEL